MTFTPNELEQRVQLLSEETGRSQRDIREQLMRQYDLSSSDWIHLNPSLAPSASQSEAINTRLG